MNKRKICLVTTTRAEYGILKPLLTNIDAEDTLTLQLVVTGTHLSKKYGETYKEIEKDGFKIDAKIAMNLDDDSNESLSLAMAQLQSDITKVFADLKPAIVVILGDRYEILTVATAAMMLHIPLAHIHGGELTEGAMDDSIRHAVTKLSHLHFTSTQEYAQRVIQLGEDPRRVFYVGSLAVEQIKKLPLLSKEELEKSLAFSFGEKNLLVTYHPETLSKLSPQAQFQELLSAIETLKDTKIIFTKANADAGGAIINTMIEEYVQKNSDKAVVFSSLGQLRYFSTIKYVDAVVGNSSSGILEVPSFGKPTINIGQRQKGRTQALSIINVKILQEDIKKAICKVYDKEFLQTMQNVTNPYALEGTSQKIQEVLRSVALDSLLQKKFYDIKKGRYE